MASEAELLAAIDDAEFDVELYERVLRVIGLVAGVSLVLFVSGIVLGALSVGSGIDYGGIAAALIAPSATVGSCSLGVGWWWFYRQNTRENRLHDPGIDRPWTGGPKKQLRKARRAHEQWLMGQAR